MRGREGEDTHTHLTQILEFETINDPDGDGLYGLQPPLSGFRCDTLMSKVFELSEKISRSNGSCLGRPAPFSPLTRTHPPPFH